jgi:methylated-DNA-[protein]-cysteine S-methyltransferase
MSSIASAASTQLLVMRDTPVGPLTLISKDGRLAELRFGSHPQSRSANARQHSICLMLRKTERELNEYFCGVRREFSVAWAWQGTPFQIRVWKGLLQIPFGQTCSYSDLARRIGSPQSARAVGMALGRNPISIIVPCHRVIGANGSLVGFGGGLENKRRLLEFEEGFV